MAPAQGPTTPSRRAEKTSIHNSNVSKNKMFGKGRKKPIALDQMSLTFMSSIYKDRQNDNLEERSNINVDFFSAVAESVQPAVYIALDTRVWYQFYWKIYIRVN